VSPLLLAALLPLLFWDQGPETADQLLRAGIREVAVPPSLEAAWKSKPDLAVRIVNSAEAVKLTKPGVQMRPNVASATRSPWVDTNAWKLLRAPAGRFFYEAPGPAASLAAAEAHQYGAEAWISTDSAGLEPLAAMLGFLIQLKPFAGQPVADIGFVDDGSTAAGEVINLMVRRNLLFRIVKAPDNKLRMNVPFGAGKYTRQAAANPSEMAQQIRAELTDEKRSLRIYGSEVVIARLTGDGRRLRVQLLNYAARPVNGLRVRVRGVYKNNEVRVFGLPDAALLDFESDSQATEFTLRQLPSYAVVDLTR